ncbi:HNH endonuclease signature motif containing protein [Paraburkholderia sp. IMGN_8]|uniref:HNH endonuclease signature motif containing protein n=1 Tax=Paraburkholderia sp. IMGN_8 TaxID=3136564 RepID=UPI0032AEE2FC
MFRVSLNGCSRRTDSDEGNRLLIRFQPITKDTGWHVHHIVRRVDGGGNASRDLIMVHPTCHAQIHSLGLSVTKPAPHQGL